MLVPISFGLKWVIGISVISYLVVPSLLTQIWCFTLNIPFVMCSGIWSLLLVPLTPFIKSGKWDSPISFIAPSMYSLMGIFCLAYFCGLCVHCSSLLHILQLLSLFAFLSH